MLERKIAAIHESGADVVVLGDASCMTQIAGGLRKAGSRTRVRHIAEVLNNSVP
jgi:L-lactate dehydrogenase complex protein LldE